MFSRASSNKFCTSFILKVTFFLDTSSFTWAHMNSVGFTDNGKMEAVQLHAHPHDSFIELVHFVLATKFVYDLKQFTDSLFRIVRFFLFMGVLFLYIE